MYPCAQNISTTAPLVSEIIICFQVIAKQITLTPLNYCKTIDPLDSRILHLLNAASVNAGHLNNLKEDVSGLIAEGIAEQPCQRFSIYGPTILNSHHIFAMI